ncbi:glycoside hydrolase family 2 TIM barrel-domain containing protein [Yinghuangia sp. YIM S09857]|uniref:glycoside hydrolase family 2 TIM barrel-domain containing protein n=1 Tax=Yinghuangia sp. YIM S09857 TaxID=3436929 RepID=UPI003F5334A6
MIRSAFNRGWEVRPRSGPFAEFMGPPDPYVEVTLPHDAMLARERSPGGTATLGFFPEGAYEYRKTFHVPEEYRGKRVAIEFEGVYRGAMVYINDEFAGQRPFGYSAFVVPADNFLRYGEDNEVRVECRTHHDSRWYSGAGIYRDVHLAVGNMTRIPLDGVRVTTPDVDTDQAVVVVATLVEHDGPTRTTVDVVTEIRDAAGAVVATDRSVASVFPGEPATVRQRLYVKRPELWSVDTPVLYTATVALRDGSGEVDRDQAVFGVRTLRLDVDHGLRINGVPVKLRGACVHHDNGVIGAATIARAEERRVQLLKDAGFNAVRSAHNPLSRAMLDACDRVGMLVLDEAFDMWTHNKTDGDYGLDFPTWWERDLEAMVRKDANHPSVVMYSIGNEILELGNPSGAAWARRLAEKVRALDDTRYVTNGVNLMLPFLKEVVAMVNDGAPAQAQHANLNAMMAAMDDAVNTVSASEMVTTRTAEAFAVLDVAGMNYADSRYELDRELFPNRIIVGSETVAKKIDTNWRLVLDNSHVLGDFTWTGWDYLGEPGLGMVGYADRITAETSPAQFLLLTARAGDIDITGHRRPASYYREIVFGLRKDPYIAVQPPSGYGRETVSGPWAWTDTVSSWTWDHPAGSPVKVEVYSDADEVEILCNGDVVGKAPAGELHRFRAEFDTTYHPGELIAVAYKDGVEQGRHRLATATGPLALVADVDRATLRADDTDLAYVALTLTDADGNVHRDRDRQVAVRVTGPAVLQGLGSADPLTREPFTADTHTTYEGRALAVIRPTGPGEITVTATAADCHDATVTVQAE